MMQDFKTATSRRNVIRGGAMLAGGALLMRPATALATDSNMVAIRKAAEAGRDASLKRIRDWIALPSIAAETGA